MISAETPKQYLCYASEILPSAETFDQNLGSEDEHVDIS